MTTSCATKAKHEWGQKPTLLQLRSAATTTYKLSNAQQTLKRRATQHRDGVGTVMVLPTTTARLRLLQQQRAGDTTVSYVPHMI
jgi:hypothetical protein